MKNDRIIIVGGGCAGISAARFLAQHGYHHVTILESADREGGKCTSVRYEEGWHELATSYTAWGYHTFQKWLNEHGIPIYKIKPPYMLNGEGNDKKMVTLREYTLGGTKLKHKLRALSQLISFEWLWVKFFIHELFGSKNNKHNVRMAIPFGEWLDHYNLDIMKRLAGRAIVSAGYGHLETIPTLHCLRWLKPSIIIAGLIGQIWEPVPGFQNVWRVLGWEHDIRYNEKVNSISKVRDFIAIKTASGTEYTCGDVIIAVPMSRAKHFFNPLTPQFNLCSKMYSHVYSTFLFTCKERLFESEHEAVGLPYNFDENKLGNVLVLRRTGEKTPTMKLREKERRHYYVSYQYKMDQTEDRLISNLTQEIQSLRGEVSEILEVSHFDYMQTYDREEIKAGIVKKINDLQGKDNIWFSTSSVSFESIDNIIDTNEELIKMLINSKKRNTIFRKFSLFYLRFGRIFKSIIFIRYWLFAIKR